MSKQRRAALENRTNSSSKIRPIVFTERSGDSAIRALSILQGVRESGKGRLTLRAAINAALEQGAEFERWSQDPAPIERVQVWVESHLVMTVSPEDSSVKLMAFKFEVPSPRDAVMRVLKADEGKEPVVLLNLPLSIVPLVGLDETRPLPNGQKIRLVIARGEESRFEVLVAFVPEEVPESLSTASSADAIRSKEESTISNRPAGNRLGYIPLFLRQSKLAWIASAAAIVVALMITIWTKSIEHRYQWSEHSAQVGNNSFANANIPSQSSALPSESAPMSGLVGNTRRNTKRNVGHKVNSRITAAILTLEPYQAIRGPSETPIVRKTAIASSRSSFPLELKLPTDSQAGTYRIRLVDPYDRIVYEINARSADGKRLRIMMNRKVFSLGTHVLEVSSGDQVPVHYFVTVVN